MGYEANDDGDLPRFFHKLRGARRVCGTHPSTCVIGKGCINVVNVAISEIGCTTTVHAPFRLRYPYNTMRVFGCGLSKTGNHYSAILAFRNVPISAHASLLSGKRSIAP